MTWTISRKTNAVDLEAVNVTDKVDKITVEKADRSTEVNKDRFLNQTQELQSSPVKAPQAIQALFFAVFAD